MIECRHFNGYKPCQKSEKCNRQCVHFQRVVHSILIVHLGALGAVVRSTSLLAAIRRKYRNAHITWVTQAPADDLLRGNPEIDRVLTTSQMDLLSLSVFEFDVGFVIDKSAVAAGILKLAKVHESFGFTVHPKTGGIGPKTKSAMELWSLGLDNHQKFFVNEKPETQLVTEALELGPFERDPYQVTLSAQEIGQVEKRRSQWRKSSDQPILGVNTGCSQVIPYKKLTVEYQRQLTLALLAEGFSNIVMLGGREDTERNQAIAQGLPVFCSSTENGLRDGLMSIAACDIVLTGDSLGMHMAISQKKWVIAWFGPTCAQEIDLFDRGEKILSEAKCSPCWKRLCSQEKMCYDQLDIATWINAVNRGYQIWKTESLLFKQPSLEIFS